MTARKTRAKQQLIENAVTVPTVRRVVKLYTKTEQSELGEGREGETEFIIFYRDIYKFAFAIVRDSA